MISLGDLQSFAGKQAPLLKGNIAWAAETQVNHWMGVIAGWKKLLGSDWDKTYAASNTIYVARQNNVLFSVLAQFFGPDAINSRLMLIETISFTTTPEDMLEALTRIIADRSVGAMFFGNYYLMDYELMGGDGRKAIAAQSAKYDLKPFAAGGAFRLAPMADPDHAWRRPRLARRSAVTGQGEMDLNTVIALRSPRSAAEIAEWGDGFAWLAGGTWLFSEPQPATDTLIDLGQLAGRRWRPRPPGSTSARPAASPSSIASRHPRNGLPPR